MGAISVRLPNVLKTERCIAERAQRGSAEAFRAALAAVPSQPTEEHDRLAEEKQDKA